MNSRFAQCLSAVENRFWLLLAFGLLGLGCASSLRAEEPHTAADLTVHEWGTFTAIAGIDGRAMQWQTLKGTTDLPGFVEHFSAANFKSGLMGTIRMETPVLYFYAPRDLRLSVNVKFSRGVITEWYPHAARTRPSEALFNTDLRQLRSSGSIAWDGITVSPELSGEFPREAQSSRYYAARETSSTPLSVGTKTGPQLEKFLFYRGVSAASLSLSVDQSADGELLVKSLDDSVIPATILFERRGKLVGYRLVDAPTSAAVLQPPDLSGNLESLLGDLERILVDQGLYPDEAHAMVETWRDSWFEEGSRLIYIVPRSFVDQILPLTIEPVPLQVVRVFVGRLEIVTPATAKAVSIAIAAHDQSTLNKYGRFLEAILEIASRSNSNRMPDRYR
jgi:hypothetical protein